VGKSVNRRKKKRSSKAKSAGAPPASTTSGGVMQSRVSGFRTAVGVEKRKKKASWIENLIWAIVLLAAIGFLISRYTN
jgi:hypothetical protein